MTQCVVVAGVHPYIKLLDEGADVTKAASANRRSKSCNARNSEARKELSYPIRLTLFTPVTENYNSLLTCVANSSWSYQNSLASNSVQPGRKA
jgi:hypothetical protein